MTTMVDGRKTSKTDRMVLARQWVAKWPVGTPGRVYRGPVLVVEHQVSRGWPLIVVELLRPFGDMPSGTRLYIFYGARRDMERFN